MKNKNFRPRLFSVLREAVMGKSVGRTLTNLYWRNLEDINGNVLDIGGGTGRASHYRFLPFGKVNIKTVDVVKSAGVDFVLDLNIDKIPVPDNSINCIFLFNILEHVYDHKAVLGECFRVLIGGSRLIGTIPFLVNVHPDPHDYIRFTKESLISLFERNGFKIESVEAIGRGPFLAGYEQLDSLVSGPLHLLFLPVVWILDSVVSILRPSNNYKEKFPLAYNFIVEKKV